MNISGYCGLIAAALTFGLVSAATSAEGKFQQAAPSGPKNPAGTVVRYRISDWISVDTAGIEHATQVTTITNQSPNTCGVGVDLDFSNGNTACTLNNPFSLPAGQSVNICSRGLTFPIVNCQVFLNTCSFSGFGFVGGSGKVWTNTCTNIAVSARTIYTDAADAIVQGISDAKLVKSGAANIGD